MEASYKRDLNHTYVILRGDQPVDTASYPVRMMLSNQWKAFLPCTIQGMDNQVFFYYEITEKQSFSGLFGEKKLNYLQLRQLVEALLQSLEEAQEYLLDGAYILLDPAYIFWDSQEESFQFCYFPGEKQEENRGIRELTEYLLPRIDHQDQDAVVLGYGMYRTAMEENFHGGQLRELLYQSSETAKTESKRAEEEKGLSFGEHEDDFTWWAEEPEEKEADAKKQSLAAVGAGAAGLVFLGTLFLFLKGNASWKLYALGIFVAIGFMTVCAGMVWKLLRKKPASVKEDVHSVEKEGPATTLLYREKKEEARLIPVSKGNLETFALDEEVLLIGKLAGTVALVIDVPTVSRIHARIREERGNYYVQDLHSKNGTFVNQRKLEGEEQVRLEHKDVIRFADISYQFYLEKDIDK